ncbi:MAG: transporter [Bacteroidetes bacterium HGW-Bacteroidetes-13]|nr:MAG: transporter [Bacteroidetes bacterium HGW-Bacteroidetes-13]
MKKTLFLSILLSAVSMLSEAQQTFPISKEDVLAKVQAENSSIKISEQTILEAKGDYRQTNAVFLPNISVSHTAFSTNNPVFAFGSKLNQGVFSEADFDVNKLNNPESIENFTTNIQFEQPLINMDGFYQRGAAQMKLQASEFQSDYQKNTLQLEAEKTYMTLQLAYKAVFVLEKAKVTALENQKTAQRYFDQGMLLHADVLDVEVRLNEIENQLDQANSQLKNVSDYLKFLMNESDDKILIPNDELEITPISLSDFESISTNRPDIKALETASLAYKKINQSDKMSFLPTLNAFGNYELFDNQLFQGASNSYFVGAQLKWDILQGSKRFGKTQKSKAEYDKSVLQYEQYVSKSKIELNKAKRAVQDAQNKLQRAATARKQSEEALRIRTDRFREGLEKTSDVLQSESQYAQSQLAYYQSIFEYNFACANLKFLTN